MNIDGNAVPVGRITTATPVSDAKVYLAADGVLIADQGPPLT